jgi:tetratricopeptide (TPR) repeat protein
MVAGTIVYFPLRKAMMLATSLPMAQGKALARVLVDLPGLALAYVASFLSPFSLSPDRQFWEGYVPLGFAALALLAGIFIVVRRRLPVERKPGLAVAFAALLGYGVLLLPAALGFRSFGVLADRYVFFPFLYLAMACLFLARFCQPEIMRFSALLRRVPVTLWAGLLIATTAMQIGAWHDEKSLARYSLTMDPDSGAALYRMATVLTNRGDFRAALPLLERYVARNPNEAKVLNNLAVTYLNLERLDDAKETLRRALPLSGATDRKFWYNVASVQLAAGKIPKACGALVRALEIDPGYSAALAMQQQICPRYALPIHPGTP